MALFLSVFASLFSVINPLGTLPFFVSLTQEQSKKEIKNTSLLTCINIMVILTLSFFAGKYILSFFGISLNALKIAGGLVIASSGFALLKGEFTENRGLNKRRKKAASLRENISLTPLAIPMMAGPGSISLLITLNQDLKQSFDILIIIAAVLLVCLICYLMLRGSQFIVKTLGPNGINSISRIIGFIVIALGIEYLWAGISAFVKML